MYIVKMDAALFQKRRQSFGDSETKLPQSHYIMSDEPESKKRKLERERELPSIERVRVANLLSPNSNEEVMNIWMLSQSRRVKPVATLTNTIDDVHIPTKTEQKLPTTQQPDEDNNNEEHAPFKFKKGNPRHVELENINQCQPHIVNSGYEALKLQEIGNSASGGPRIAKIQILSLECENLQFLELFSLKQMITFKEDLKLPKLRSIRLIMLSRITTEGLAHLLNCSNELEQVFLMDLPAVTSIVLPPTAPKLQSFDMNECKAVESLSINTNSLKELTISDGRVISKLTVRDPTNGLSKVSSLRFLGCPKLPLDFLYPLRIQHLKRLDIVSNAPSAKAYMKVDAPGFHKFVQTNCTELEEISLDKVHGVSLDTVMDLIDQCHITLQKVSLDLTSVEKPRVRAALRHCENLKDMKVEKWYIKKKWNEW